MESLATPFRLLHCNQTKNRRYGYGFLEGSSSSLLPLPSPSSLSSSPSSSSLPFRRSAQFSSSSSSLLSPLNGFIPSFQNSKQWQWRGARASASAAAVAAESSSRVQVTETLEPNSRVRLSVKVPPSICKESYEEVIREYSKKSKVPGFRPGKNVPESILVNFVGKERIETTAIEAVLRRTLPEAMSSVAGKALKDSEHIVTKFDKLRAEFSPSGFLSYDVAVDVAPEIRWISDDAYRNLKVSVELDDDLLSPQKAAEAEFTSRLKDLGSLKIVEGRCVQMGDVAIIDVSAVRINDDGTPGDRILSAEQKGFRLDTEDRSNFLPGFVDAVMGLERGQNHSFDLVFPQTWQQESLRGVKARFTIDCKEHFYRVLPDLDDSLAVKILENCTTLDEVKFQLLEKHKDVEQKAKKQATQTALMQELSKVVVVDAPHSLMEEQGRQMYAAKLIELQVKMKLGPEQITALSSEQMVNNYLLSQKASIERLVKQTLAVAEVFRLENLKYSEEELQKEVEEAERELKSFNQEYDKERVKEQAIELLEAAKVLDWLREHADITYVSKKEAPF